MSLDAWITLGVLVAVIGLLAATRIGPDLIMLAGLTVLLVAGVVGPEEALSGLSNPGIIAVIVLLAVAAGLNATGALGWVAQHVLGRPKSVAGAQARLMAPVAVMSAFLNNTPVVAMFVPTVVEWARQHRMSVSKLLMPLSYAAILGGMCTLIGTSTNLVINGLLITDAHRPGLGLFDIAAVGLPCAVLGMGYVLLAGRWLLPERKGPLAEVQDPRQYTVEMLVEPGSSLVGKTIEQAGLRHLEGLYLMEIDRAGEPIVAVEPAERLKADDRLIFVGVVESVVQLRRMRGLRLATDQVFKLDAPPQARALVEAVVSDSCGLIGQTIRDGRFRSVYGAAVIAVSRNGRRIRKKIGDIVLRPGDTLLLEAHPSFVDRQRDRRDFYLVSAVRDSSPPRHDRIWYSLAILAGMVAVVTIGWLSMLQAALLAAGLMVVTRCLTGPEARRSIDRQLLLVIAAAFGIGKAVQTSGLAADLAGAITHAVGASPWVSLAIISGLASLMTGFISNNAVAVLMFPIAMSAARDLNVSILPFAISLMVVSAGSFATPLGYQTNLMVYGPGGYRLGDYLRMGLPLHLLSWLLAVTLTPLIWPF